MYNVGFFFSTAVTQEGNDRKKQDIHTRGQGFSNEFKMLITSSGGIQWLQHMINRWCYYLRVNCLGLAITFDKVMFDKIEGR